MLKIQSKLNKDSIKITLFNNNYNKELESTIIRFNQNGSQAFEAALLRLCTYAKKLNRDKLAISMEDEIFTQYSPQTIKEIVNRTIFGCEIIGFVPPKWITSRTEIEEILHNYRVFQLSLD